MTKPKRGPAVAGRLDLYRDVTDRIVAALAQGVRPWSRPWDVTPSGGCLGRPRRACGKAYRGVNVMILWLAASVGGYRSPFWLTFHQALELGGNVRRGERGTKVCFYGQVTHPEGDPDAEDHQMRRISFLRSYTVFSAEQCDGLPAHLTATASPPSATVGRARLEHADAFVAHVGADIRHGGVEACYNPRTDHITMPPFAVFRSAEDYYSTLLHELVHFTKHPARLDRDCGRMRWGDEGYAREELVAELGSAYLCADLQLRLHERDDHASYIGEWIKVLANDRRAIFQAAALAERAVDWLRARQPTSDATDPDETIATRDEPNLTGGPLAPAAV